MNGNDNTTSIGDAGSTRPEGMPTQVRGDRDAAGGQVDIQNMYPVIEIEQPFKCVLLMCYATACYFNTVVCMYVFDDRERTDCPKKTILGRK